MPLDGPAGQGELTDQEGVGAGGELVEQRPEKPDIHIVKMMTRKISTLLTRLVAKVLMLQPHAYIDVVGPQSLNHALLILLKAGMLINF